MKGVRVALIEGERRLGGKIRTEELEGRPVEAGPDGLLARVPWAVSLCEELGLADDLIPAAAQGAHLWSRGRLRPLPAGLVLGLPTSPLATIRSGILSPWGMLRAGADLILPNRMPSGDISVGTLVRHRLGRQALERLVDPLLGGIYAGRADELSLRAAAPQIDAVARAHRSLLLGFRSARREAPPARSGPSFITLRGGLERLVDALRERIRPSATLFLARPVLGLARGPDDDWRLDLGNESVGAQAVILAVPAFAAERLVRGVSPGAARELACIDYASVATVTLAYPAAAWRSPPKGTGFLVPPMEGATMTACTWVSAKWPHLAPPDGGQLVRCSVGRSGNVEALSLDDDELIRVASTELAGMMGLREGPRASKVCRWERALPQYRVGHLERVESARGSLPPTLALAGAAYGGVGIPDCIRQGAEAARQVLAALQRPEVADNLLAAPMDSRREWLRGRPPAVRPDVR